LVVAVLALGAVATGAVLLSGGNRPGGDPAALASTAPPDTQIDRAQPAVAEEAAPGAGARDNSAALAATLAPGTYAVGVDVQPGHYTITAGSGDLGTLLIDSATSPRKANELLGEGEFSLGCAGYTTDLAVGDTLTWQGNSPITLSPAATRLANEWGPGNYVVGLDIPAGSYLPVPQGEWPGNLQVFAADGRTLVNVVIVPEDSASVEIVVLEDGQRVDLAGFTSLRFDPA
jgi:hypothetical protein